MKTAMDFQWKTQPDEIDSRSQIAHAAPGQRHHAGEQEALRRGDRPVNQQFEGSIGKSFLDLAVKELS